MNSKKDKIELLKAIRAGKIKPEDLPENPTIISNVNDVFYGMLISFSRYQRGKEDRVVYVGEAMQALEKAAPEISRLVKQYREKDQHKGESIAQ
ncbi:MAG: hypothetical protein AB7U05_04815 [Mangrovibacterium sp.]